MCRDAPKAGTRKTHHLKASTRSRLPIGNETFSESNRYPSKFHTTATFRTVDPLSEESSALPMREDIDMVAQLESIAEQRRNGCSQADWRVYVTTWATQETHEKFLLSLLGEARRYSREHGLYSRHRENMRDALRRVQSDMSESVEDNYLTIASEIAAQGLFHLPTAIHAAPPATPSYRRSG